MKTTTKRLSRRYETKNKVNIPNSLENKRDTNCSGSAGTSGVSVGTPAPSLTSVPGSIAPGSQVRPIRIPNTIEPSEVRTNPPPGKPKVSFEDNRET